VKPPPFDYVRAESLEEALAALEEGGDDAKPIAGGQSLVPALTMRLVRPSVLVDVNHAGLGGIVANGEVRIGATVRQAALAEDERVHPLIRRALPFVGHFVTRNRGTIGGSIAHADPASDLPATTMALGATYVAQGPNGTREIPAAEFYESFLTSTLAPDELLTEIRVPKMQGAGWGFQKFNRRAQDWAIVGVAAWRRNGDAGVGLVNMGSTPILATSVASALAGGASVADAAEQAAAEADPQTDLNASVEYRVHLAKVLTRRALEAASS
jgi:aerobic carbon-monoxide dehydrogenase medium subunit